MHIKRDVLVLSTILFAVCVGPGMKIIFMVGAYYLLSAFVFLITNLIYQSKYLKNKRKLKKIDKLISRTLSSLPAQIREFDDWLKKEGFVLRVNTLDSLYLESKTTRVDFYSTFKDRLYIRSLDENNKEYLIYDDDELIKMRFEDYLAYMTARNQKLTKSENKFSTLNSELFITNTRRDWNLSNFWNISVRGQGYIFLIIGLMNVSEDYWSNVLKLFSFIIYFIIEAA